MNRKALDDLLLSLKILQSIIEQMDAKLRKRDNENQLLNEKIDDLTNIVPKEERNKLSFYPNCI